MCSISSYYSLRHQPLFVMTNLVKGQTAKSFSGSSPLQHLVDTRLRVHRNIMSTSVRRVLEQKARLCFAEVSEFIVKLEDTSKSLISGALYLETSGLEPKARWKAGVIVLRSALGQHDFVAMIRGCCRGVERGRSRRTRRMLTIITEKT